MQLLQQCSIYSKNCFQNYDSLTAIEQYKYIQAFF